MPIIRYRTDGEPASSVLNCVLVGVEAERILETVLAFKSDVPKTPMPKAIHVEVREMGYDALAI